MTHIGLVLGFVGRLEAIRRALAYDLVRCYPQLTGAAAILWRANMDAWKLAALP